MANKSRATDAQGSSSEAITNDYQRLALAYLIEHGTAAERDVIAWVTERQSDGPACDHARVRTAVTLRVSHFPALEEAGYIRREEGELEADFLPPEVYNAASSEL